MISVHAATQSILSSVYQFPVETVPLSEARGRVLQENIMADRDFPPYDRVTMDGIAIDHASFKQGIRSFPIQSTQQAGMPQQTLGNPAHCIEVMTGAMLPIGTDSVIRYEDLDIQDGSAHVKLEKVGEGQNVHNQGEDREKGAILLGSGRLISAPEIAIAATAGYAELQVSRRPSIAIISTGDELVEVDQSPLPHQIRTSNSYMIQAAVAELGMNADRLHILDDKDQIRTTLAQLLEEYEVLILSGGVSKGKADYIPDAMTDLGVKKQFHRVAQRPGKPFWFGLAPNNRHVFALPGNPVSTFVNYHRYVLPWLQACLNLAEPRSLTALLAEDHHFKPDLTYFLQVKINPGTDGCLYAQPIAGHGSGDHANLLYNDGFLELPRGREVFRKGEVFPLIPYRPLIS
ncbi:MAG: molybdopterin molybdotransferase MoeA [Bacteroidota bacterium]